MANPYKVTNHDNNMCFTGKHNPWWSAYSNQAVFIDYYTRLKEYAINMFEWHNLPLMNVFLNCACLSMDMQYSSRTKTMGN